MLRKTSLALALTAWGVSVQADPTLPMTLHPLRSRARAVASLTFKF
jgi:hypothetical protein